MNKGGLTFVKIAKGKILVARTTKPDMKIAFKAEVKPRDSDSPERRLCDLLKKQSKTAKAKIKTTASKNPSFETASFFSY